MIMDAAIVKAMNLQDFHNYINNRKPEELQTLIALAKERINQLDQEKEAKYMAAIIKSVQDYLDNVGDSMLSTKTKMVMTQKLTSS